MCEADFRELGDGRFLLELATTTYGPFTVAELRAIVAAIEETFDDTE